MITEDYVSFETAKLLKEKGFNSYVTSFYEEDGNPCVELYASKELDWNSKTEFYSRPTLQMAMKWLREVHNLHIQPETTAWPRKGYFVKIYLYKNRHNNFEKVPFVEHKESYEEACEAAVKYCLENLV